MRIKYKKYLFEIVVIFIGITLGFLFDEWREGREEKRIRKELFSSMESELIRVRGLFQAQETEVSNQLISIQKFINHEFNNDSIKFEVIYSLTRELSHLQGMFVHINSLVHLNTNRIAEYNVIAKNLTFISNMEADHERIRERIQEINHQSLYPLLIKYNVLHDIYLYSTTEDLFELSGNYMGLEKDEVFINQLKLLYTKYQSIEGLSNHLIARIDDIITEVHSKQ